MSSRPLTTTSYAILGLIATRPRSTYELAQMMRRSLHFVWPRAESNVYAEPKRLVDGGLATAEVLWTGDRKRTVYSITPEGADALRAWLADDPGPQRVESEAAVRILFGHLGTKDDLLAAIARVEADADEWITEVSQVADVYDRNGSPEHIHGTPIVAHHVVGNPYIVVSHAINSSIAARHVRIQGSLGELDYPIRLTS